MIVPPPPRSSLQRSSRQRKAVPSHWPLKRALPAGWLLFLSLVTGSSYTRLHFATLCACVMAGSHSLCHHSARVARRTPLAMHCLVQSAVTQPSGTMRWEASQSVCCGKYAMTWQQSHLFSLWLAKPSLPVLSSATTRLAWTSPRVAFWGGRFEKAFFDVRVFNPSAPSNHQPQMSATYRKHEKEKRRHSEHWINEIERSSFTPLVFSTTGGMGPSALTFYRRLADLLGERRNTPFNVIIAWMRTCLSFALLRASIMCLRGSRVRRTVPWNDLPADVVVCEGRLGRS